eukprot:jgi/Bigna1/89005/estExt_fgenesh1_pg.C_420054
MEMVLALLLLTALPAYGWDNPCIGRQKALPFCNPSKTIDQRAKDLVKRISKKDKLGLLLNGAAAAPSVEIPEYQWWNEALHGVGISPGVTFNDSMPFATSFPQVQTTSMSFNHSLFHKIGIAIGTEARAFGNEGHSGFTFWTPNINVFRDPRWGRGQETPGEDPHLNGVYAKQFVTGFQGSEDVLRVSACCKHFEAYSLERVGKGKDQVTRHNFNAIVTKRDELDTYRPAFEACVREGKASGLMCSYNAVNGVPSCASSEFMTDLVRDTWGFDGYITSDCGALEDVYEPDLHNYTHTVGATINATFGSGMDSNCGGFANKTNLHKAIKSGEVSWDVIDTALINLEKVRLRLGMYDPPASVPYSNLGKRDVATPQHRQLALEAAQQGITLLKNDHKALPFGKKHSKSGRAGDLKIALIGPHANASHVMLGNYEGKPPHITTPAEAFQRYAKSVSVEYGCGNGVACNTTEGYSAALEAASKADIVVMLMGIDQSIEAEGLDRVNITLPGFQEHLSKEVAKTAAKAGAKVVLVILAGGSVDLSFARDSKQIPSILWAGYPGEAGSTAISQIIFGDVNPSGRLSQTLYPKDFVDQVSMMNMNMRPGPESPGRTYRFYTGEVIYPFAHGLSYAEFAYTWMKKPPQKIDFWRAAQAAKATARSSIASLSPLGESSPPLFSISVSVTNTAGVSGSESVLLFVRPPSSGTHGAAIRTLRSFKKIRLEAGETKIVNFDVHAEDLSVARHETHSTASWTVLPGKWEFQV